MGVGRVFDRTWVGVWQLSFLTHAHLFALGLALAVVRVEWQDGRLRLPAWWRPVAAVALVVVAAAIVKLGADAAIASKWQVALVAVVCGLLLALTVLPPARSRSRLIGTLESPAFVATGLASYSVYLWHAPIILWLRVHGVTHGGGFRAFGLNLLIVGTITGSASWLTYRYVEKPALRLKSRTRVKRAEPGPAGAADEARGHTRAAARLLGLSSAPAAPVRPQPVPRPAEVAASAKPAPLPDQRRQPAKGRELAGERREQAPFPRGSAERPGLDQRDPRESSGRA